MIDFGHPWTFVNSALYEDQGIATGTFHHLSAPWGLDRRRRALHLKPTPFLTVKDVTNLRDPSSHENIKIKKKFNVEMSLRLNQFLLLIFVQGAAGDKAPLARWLDRSNAFSAIGEARLWWFILSNRVAAI